MLKTNNGLQLDHCHHCGVDAPVMTEVSSFVTNNHRQDAPREWTIHHCDCCGGAVLCGSVADSGVISEIHPAAIKSGQNGQLQDALAGLSADESQQRHVADDADALAQALYHQAHFSIRDEFHQATRSIVSLHAIGD